MEASPDADSGKDVWVARASSLCGVVVSVCGVVAEGDVAPDVGDCAGEDCDTPDICGIASISKLRTSS